MHTGPDDTSRGHRPIEEPSHTPAPVTGGPRYAPLRSGPLRWVLFALGTAFTTLATVGAFLPVLPTTPFLLLAGACFVRSSPDLHRRLQTNRVFGPYVVQWQRDHTVPREAKRKAYGLVIASFTLSIVLVDMPWLRVVLVGVGLALLGFLRWLPTTATGPEPQRGEPAPRLRPPADRR